MWFTLVVDDFGIKYVGEENAKHLINALCNNYTIETDWTGSLYCGINLTWNYDKKYVDIAMPNYVLKQLTKYNYTPKRPQHCPYSPAPMKYGNAAQEVASLETTKELDEPGKKRIQKVVGSFLFYGRAVDLTMLAALSAIAG